jgi:hypothetical protein
MQFEVYTEIRLSVHVFWVVTLCSGRWVPKFHRIILPPSAVRKPAKPTCQVTRRQTPKIINIMMDFREIGCGAGGRFD